MPKLRLSRVYRGGVTAPELKFETLDICADVSNELKFHFSIPSKGGGETAICLAVANTDLPFLLREIAENLPEMAEVFAEATLIAIKKSKNNPSKST